MADTKYCHPDTDVLINKLDIRELDKSRSSPSPDDSSGEELRIKGVRHSKFMKMQRKQCRKRLTGCWLQKQVKWQCIKIRWM